MTVFPVKFDEFDFKIMADTGKDFLQIIKNGLCKGAIPVLCNKDQMGVKEKYAVSSLPDILDFFRGPTIIPL